MSDKAVKPEVVASEQDSVDKILEKLNGLEYMRLASWMDKKMVKAAEAPKVEVEITAEPVKADAVAAEPTKEEVEKTAVEKAIDTVKNSFLGKLFSKAVKTELEKASAPAPVAKELRAEFTKAENLGDSFWTLYRGDKKILRATLKTIFEETLEDKDIATMASSEEYGNKLVETYKEIGFVKTAKLLGVAFKVAEKTKADKELEKSYEAINEKDQTEVGTHLDSSKPESSKEAASKSADLPGVETPKEEVKVVDNIEEALPTDAPKPEVPGLTEEKPLSAFDKIEDKLIVSEGVEAHKDKETNEIVVVDATGSELKRLPDGFGDDVPTVLKLLQSIMGVEEHNDATPAAPVVDAPKPDAAPVEAPVVDESKTEVPAMASKKETLTKEAEELQKKAEELAKKEAELKKIEAKIQADKFASALNARTERCKKVVEGMVTKDLLPLDETVLNVELQKGATLLDARKAAYESAINAKVKSLLAMDDASVENVEKTVQGLKKSASKLSTPVSLEYVARTEDDDIQSIFDSMH